MTKLLEMTNELYESRNMVKFLKRKLQADSKQPVPIADAISSVRVSLSLQRRLAEFLNTNPLMQVYSKKLRIHLSDLNEVLNGLSNKYSEEDEFNLSSKQKNFLIESINQIDIAILNMAGKIYYSLIEVNGLTRLNSEQREFLDEAEKIFTKEEELSIKMSNKMEEAETRGIDFDELEDDEDDFILGGTPPKVESKPRQIISENIDE